MRTMDIYVTVVHTRQAHIRDCTLQTDINLLAHTQQLGHFSASPNSAVTFQRAPCVGQWEGNLPGFTSSSHYTQSSVPLDQDCRGFKEGEYWLLV